MRTGKQVKQDKKKRDEEIKQTGTYTPVKRPQTGYQIGNQTVNKEEYNAVKSRLGFDSGGGALNEKSAQVLQDQKNIEQDIKLRNEIEQKQNREAAIGRLVGTGQTTTDQIPSPSPQINISNSEAALEKLRARAQVPLTPIEETKATSEAIMGGQDLGVLGSFEKATQLMAQEVALIYNNVAKTVTQGDTAQIQNAREQFSKAGSLINAQIQDVKTGQLDYNTVLQNIQLAVDANAAIEATSKRKGVENLRYWLIGGKDLEVEAALNKQVLQNYLRDLEAARLSGAAAQLGL